MRQHEVLLTVDDFRIALRVAAFEVCIEHRCHRWLKGMRHEWQPHVWAVPYRGDQCAFCSQAAPESIQATFWFLKEG